ncbi:MAG: 3-isopropylmalate dehydratase small subunit [Gemmatimonadaceae bacterium]
MKEPITTFTSHFVVLDADDVDTDQIIPARFLTTTKRTGLRDCLFFDWRYRPEGTPNPEFALNHPDAAGARILVTGRNFGCGSSREHAVWALTDAGFRAVISESFADIFRGNALGNGLLPIQVDSALRDELLRVPSAALTVDLATQALVRDGHTFAHFSIDPFAKLCLMRGMDELEYLLSAEARIAAYERTAAVTP